MLRINQQLEKVAYVAVLNKELEIDDQGRIWRIAKRGWCGHERKSVVRPCKRVRAEKIARGYLQVRVMKDSDRVHVGAHRLVYLHFKGEIPIGLVINHINGIKTDNRPENLELVTPSENKLHSMYVLGVGTMALNQNGEKNKMAKLKEADIIDIRKKRKEGMKLLEIGAIYNISFKTVSKIARGDRWKHIEDENS